MDCSCASSNIHLCLVERSRTKLFSWNFFSDLTTSSAVYKCSPVYKMEVCIIDFLIGLMNCEQVKVS